LGLTDEEIFRIMLYKTTGKKIYIKSIPGAYHSCCFEIFSCQCSMKCYLCNDFILPNLKCSNVVISRDAYMYLASSFWIKEGFYSVP
jgi:hypothetical protein